MNSAAPLNRQCFIARDTRSSVLIAAGPGVGRALEIAKGLRDSSVDCIR